MNLLCVGVPAYAGSRQVKGNPFCERGGTAGAQGCRCQRRDFLIVRPCFARRDWFRACSSMCVCVKQAEVRMTTQWHSHVALACPPPLALLVSILGPAHAFHVGPASLQHQLQLQLSQLQGHFETCTSSVDSVCRFRRLQAASTSFTLHVHDFHSEFQGSPRAFAGR